MKHCYIIIAALLLAAASATAQQNPGDPSMSTDPAPFRLAGISLAVTNMERMVAFYENVFQMKFAAIDTAGTKFYSGVLLGQPLLLRPNALAKVDAEQGRHQLDILVNDLDGAAARVKASGGKVRDESVQAGKRAMTIIDPDGNTMIFRSWR